MKAISIMATLAVDSENRRLYHEFEVLYADGTVRHMKIQAYKSVRLDLDSFYMEKVNAGAPNEK